MVDFSADPWRGVNDQNNSVSQENKKKVKRKLSRLEQEFSQTESQPSQAIPLSEGTHLQSSDNTEINHTDTIFQMHSFEPNFQPFQCPHFLNEQSFQQSFQYSHLHFPNEPYPQEHVFSTSFLEPALNQTSSRY